MTDTAWEALSNQAVAAAGVVYFLALIAHLVEHAAARRVLEPAATRPGPTGPRAGSPSRSGMSRPMSRPMSRRTYDAGVTCSGGSGSCSR